METEKGKEVRLNDGRHIEEPASTPLAPPENQDQDEAANVTTTKEGPRRFTFEIINLIDLFIVIFCGISLIIATVNHDNTIVNMIAGGFMGYIGGSARGMLSQYLDGSNHVKITKREVK